MKNVSLILTKNNLCNVTYLGNFKVGRLLVRLLGSSLLVKSLKLILVIQVLKIFVVVLNTQKHALVLSATGFLSGATPVSTLGSASEGNLPG